MEEGHPGKLLLEEVHHDTHLLEEVPQAVDQRQLRGEEALQAAGAPLLEEPAGVAQILAQLPGAVKPEEPVG